MWDGRGRLYPEEERAGLADAEDEDLTGGDSERVVLGGAWWAYLEKCRVRGTR